jgi:tRNA threonylcarbamoyladenosine biosynthesis protein TsaE
MQEFVTNNIEETNQIAQDLAAKLEGGEVIALSGNLGVGKTVFVKALAVALGIKEEVTSPTFVLMKVYDIKHKNIRQFIHADCYRLDGAEDLKDIGLSDFLAEDSVVVIEWADKINNLPSNVINVKFDYINDTKRRIVIDD